VKEKEGLLNQRLISLLTGHGLDGFVVKREGYDDFSTFLSEIKLEIGYAPKIIVNDLDQRSFGAIHYIS